jgi:hypothetical protein
MGQKGLRPVTLQLGGGGSRGADCCREIPAHESVSPPSAAVSISVLNGATDGYAPPRLTDRTPSSGSPTVVDAFASSVFTADRSSTSCELAGSVRRSEGNLPCLLSSNNSTEDGQKKPPIRLSSQVQKSGSALAWNVAHMSEKFGLDRLGFLTLTFPSHLENARLSQRRFNSLATHILRPRYGDYIRVLERQKSGRIHYHLLVVLPFDARSGVDFEAFGQGDYRSASKELRAEWKFWRETSVRYGFGRTELMPVRSNRDGIAKYVGKYIGKHFHQRRASDKGVRLVEYTRGARIANTKHAGVGFGARNWRERVRLFALFAGVKSWEGLREKFGPRWAYDLRQHIDSLPV